LVLVRIVVADKALPLILCSVGAILPCIWTTTSLTQEKENRSLESLLLLPASEKELLAGKVVPAALSAHISTLGVCLLTILGSGLLVSPELATYLLNARLVALCLLAAPALAVMSGLAGLTLSVTVTDSRTAVSLFWLPAGVGLAGFVLVSLTSVVLSLRIGFLETFVMLGVSAVLLGLALSLFDRERMLLRYT